jgi:hypothetical protein
MDRDIEVVSTLGIVVTDRKFGPQYKIAIVHTELKNVRIAIRE